MATESLLFQANLVHDTEEEASSLFSVGGPFYIHHLMLATVAESGCDHHPQPCGAPASCSRAEAWRRGGGGAWA